MKKVKTVKIIKATSGLKYYLTDNYLLDSAPKFYLVSRDFIADAFDGADVIAYRVVYGVQNGNGAYLPNHDDFATVNVGKNHISIGCQMFAGKNFNALKRWAKSY